METVRPGIVGSQYILGLFEPMEKLLEVSGTRCDIVPDIERILFLEGLPNMQDIGKLRIGENTREMLQCDLQLEMDALPKLRDAIAFCEECRDYVSRDLFDSILSSEEEHVDWLETQLGLIDKMGIENYLQAKMD